jgi:hypothetical protein
VPSIDRFALAASVYAAGLVAPAAGLPVVLGAVTPWPVWLALVSLSGALGGYLVGRHLTTPASAERLRGGWGAIVPFAALPAVLLVGAALSLTTLPLDAVWVSAAVGLVLSLVGALWLVSASRALYGARLRDASDADIALPPAGEKDPETARKHRHLGVALLALAVVVGVAVWYDTGEFPWFVAVAIGPLALLFESPQQRAIVDAGLRQGDGVEPWDAFAGYRLTDDEIMIERARWWRTDERIDRGALDDEDRVVEALSAVLPETP